MIQTPLTPDNQLRQIPLTLHHQMMQTTSIYSFNKIGFNTVIQKYSSSNAPLAPVIAGRAMLRYPAGRETPEMPMIKPRR